MKKKWFRTMDLVDDEYILEADPGRPSKSLHKNRIVATVLASCASLALVLSSLWLFAPYDTTPPGVKENAESAYYPVIKEITKLTWEKPRYANNFQKYLGQLLTGGVKGDSLTNGAATEAVAPGDFARPEMESPGSAMGGVSSEVTDGSTGSTYEEITDNQVEGITEADRIKRSSTHIYYLDRSTLRVFSVAGLSSQELGSIELAKEENRGYLDEWAFYLSADCKTVTVITSRYIQEQKQRCVEIIALDVSDPASITEKNRVTVNGNYLSSRITDGKLLLLTEFVLDRNAIDFEEEHTFLPQINGQSIAPEDIILPEESNSARYTVVMKLDENTLNQEGATAFLSYSEDVYVSHDHIFLTHVYADEQKVDDRTVRNSMTEISCLSYKDGFERKGSAVVRGYVKDQWSMDEYEGILRVVTTTNATSMRETYAGNNASVEILMTATGNSNASLYCIDLQSFKIVAKVEDFAPPREEVQSVRFDKTTAYVCTSIEMSDPVFFFDLSDLNNITYKDTGTIEGFSSSLVNFGDGYLLGIGQENWSTFKAEIYRETADGVEGFCQYTLDNAEYSRDYKAYYIDRENQLLGLGISKWDKVEGEWSGYILLHFDGYELVELLNVKLPGNNEWKRGVYIDGFMYMLGENAFKVEKVF